MLLVFIDSLRILCQGSACHQPKQCNIQGKKQNPSKLTIDLLVGSLSSEETKSPHLKHLPPVEGTITSPSKGEVRKIIYPKVPLLAGDMDLFPGG